MKARRTVSAGGFVRKPGAFAATVFSSLFAAGCSGNECALNPAGIQASQISNLWWFFFLITAAVYLLVLLFLLIAIFKFWGRPAPRSDDKTLVLVEERREKRIGVVVGTATGVTVLLLFLLLMGDVFTGVSLHSLGAKVPVSIKVTGHQWWWEVRYESTTPSNIVETANEIHIPVGKPIQFKLDSTDVIHSFWIPNLHGKKDMIPGHPTATWLRADRAGTYYGRCAEYCGLQHAHMRLVIVAEEPDKYDHWLAEQRKPAAEPKSNEEKHGRDVFLTSSCIMCHTIQGTVAGARLGPGLTHVANRTMLAAGRLKNNRGSLGRWILDPQHLKPGVLMPQNQFEPADFHALLDYLEILK
jgi:cytochrome c oxidase subunit 2